MAILSNSDVPLYAPSVELSGEALQGALIQAQFIAEGFGGANRRLEVQPYDLVLRLQPAQQIAHIPYFPLVIDEDRPLIVHARHTGDFSMGAWVQGDHLWETLEEDTHYILDRQTNRITLLRFSAGNSSWGLRDYYCNQYTEIRVQFYSGFEFTEPLSEEENSIKASLGQLLAYLQSPPFLGVKRLQVPFREYEIEYQQQPAGQVPEYLLQAFRRYRPVVY